MGVFASALTAGVPRGMRSDFSLRGRGLGAWLMSRFRSRCNATARLRMLENIRITPRLSVALIEADGERFLVATSDTGGPVFLPLSKARRMPSGAKASARVNGK